jgi:hypothetical protein
VKGKVEAKPQAVLREAVYPRRFNELSQGPTESTRPRTVASAVEVNAHLRMPTQSPAALDRPQSSLASGDGQLVSGSFAATNAFGVTASFMFARPFA